MVDERLVAFMVSRYRGLLKDAKELKDANLAHIVQKLQRDEALQALRGEIAKARQTLEAYEVQFNVEITGICY